MTHTAASGPAMYFGNDILNCPTWVMARPTIFCSPPEACRIMATAFEPGGMHMARGTVSTVSIGMRVSSRGQNRIDTGVALCLGMAYLTDTNGGTIPDKTAIWIKKSDFLSSDIILD